MGYKFFPILVAVLNWTHSNGLDELDGFVLSSSGILISLGSGVSGLFCGFRRALAFLSLLSFLCFFLGLRGLWQKTMLKMFC